MTGFQVLLNLSRQPQNNLILFYFFQAERKDKKSFNQDVGGVAFDLSSVTIYVYEQLRM